MKYILKLGITFFIIFFWNILLAQEEIEQQWSEDKELNDDTFSTDDDTFSTDDDLFGTDDDTFSTDDDLFGTDDDDDDDLFNTNKEEIVEDKSFIAFEEELPYVINYKPIDTMTFSPIGYWRVLGREKFNHQNLTFEKYSDAKLRDFFNDQIIYIGKNEIYGNTTGFCNFYLYESFQYENINLEELAEDINSGDFVRSLASAIRYKIRTPSIMNIILKDTKFSLPVQYPDIYIVNSDMLIIYFSENLYFLGRDTTIKDKPLDQIITWGRSSNRYVLSGIQSARIFLKLSNPKNYSHVKVSIIPAQKGTNEVSLGTLNYGKDSSSIINFESKFQLNDFNYRATAVIKYKDIQKNILLIEYNTFDNNNLPWNMIVSFIKKY